MKNDSFVVMYIDVSEIRCESKGKERKGKERKEKKRKGSHFSKGSETRDKCPAVRDY